MADIQIHGVERSELCVYYRSTVTDSIHVVKNLEGFTAFRKLLASHKVDLNHWMDPGLVFEYTGHREDATGSARAVDLVRQIFNYIHKMNWGKSLAWIQFIHFWSLDFSTTMGLRRDPIELVPGLPEDLVFSDCTIGNYQSLERLALRTTWNDDPSQCRTRITLDQGTIVWKLQAPKTPGAECHAHRLRICGFAKDYVQTANVLQLCPGIKEVVFALGPGHELVDIIRLIQSSLHERPPGYTILPELVIVPSQLPTSGDNPWKLIQGLLGPLCGTKISGLTGPRPEHLTPPSWVKTIS